MECASHLQPRRLRLPSPPNLANLPPPSSDLEVEAEAGEATEPLLDATKDEDCRCFWSAPSNSQAN